MTSEISITDVPDFLKPDVKTIIGNHTFLPEEIIRFGTLYDPQPFHTDPAAAQHSMFGGLCASGWHTASTWMKLQRICRWQSKNTKSRRKTLS
ncbi:MAG: MaoC/PaaZ C-terminal domain-containing protein [Pseudomonadota bacterium]